MISPRRIAPSFGPRRSVCAVPLLLAVVGACSFDASGIGTAGGTSETGDNATTAPDIETTVVTTSTSSTDPTTTSGGTSMGATSTDPVTTDPVTTDPVTTDPVTTDPVTTDTTAMETTAMETSSGSTAAPAFCGDGMLDPGEDCDDGNQVDGDACKNNCTPNICGDSVVGPGEGCDDGNANNNDACTNMCKVAACGDGFTQPGEVCDDGNAVDGDDCTNACKLGGTLVFVTAELFSGNLGGLMGADKICQERAVGAKLTGTWMAWLSTDNPADGPAQRFVQSTKPYRLVDGTIIANNWMDLTDGTLDAQISLTETGGAAGMTDRVWTNTNNTGSFATNSDCSGWGMGNMGTYGIRTMANGTWTNSGTSGCGDQYHLYCFQQS